MARPLPAAVDDADGQTLGCRNRKTQSDFRRTHANAVSSVAFSPDGTTLVSGSDDATVKLWDVTRQPKAPKVTFSDHGTPVY